MAVYNGKRKAVYVYWDTVLVLHQLCRWLKKNPAEIVKTALIRYEADMLDEGYEPEDESKLADWH